MKTCFFPNYFIFVLVISVLGSCISSPPPQETKKYLSHPSKEEVVLMGSVMKMDGGIMILVQNGPMKEIPTIIIPATDSAGTVLKNAYQSKIDNEYQASLQPWVKLTGNFIREDSLSPIFKYNWVLLLDESAEQHQVEEMEE